MVLEMLRVSPFLVHPGTTRMNKEWFYILTSSPSILPPPSRVEPPSWGVGRVSQRDTMEGEDVKI